jgi:hypothetical protein
MNSIDLNTLQRIAAYLQRHTPNSKEEWNEEWVQEWATLTAITKTVSANIVAQIKVEVV